MSVKTISGTYAYGYILAARYAAVSVTSSGSVASAGGALGAHGSADAPNGGAGGDAGVALSLPHGGGVFNNGMIQAGAGGVGGAGYDPATFEILPGFGGQGGSGGVGIALNAAGSIANAGLISGGAGGAGGSGGAYTGPKGHSYEFGGGGGSGGAGVSFAALSSIANSGTIQGGRGGDAFGFGSYGEGRGSIGGDGGDGIDFNHGGVVTNSGLVQGGGDGGGSERDGAGGAGIVIRGAAGAVANLGAIAGGYQYADNGDPSGAADSGVAMLAGGSIVNGSAADTAASIQGVSGAYVVGGAGTVTNFGAIEHRAEGHPGQAGFGIDLGDGGRVTNGSATDPHAYISGYLSGVEVENAAGTVANFGDIGAIGYGVGVILNRGGVVTNGGSSDHTAAIGSYFGVLIDGAAGTVTNWGQIVGAVPDRYGLGPPSRGEYGVLILDGGSFTNGALSDTTALIISYSAVYLAGVHSAQNFGTLTGFFAEYGAGAVLGPGSNLTNGAAADTHADIYGYTGVRMSAGDTVTNFATIAGYGGPSVDLLAASDRLIAEAGSTFVGQIIGGGGALELAGGTGVITGLGASGALTGAVSATFSGFGGYAIDAGAAWSLAGAGALAFGETLTVAGSLTNTGTLSGAGVLEGAGTLSNAAGAVIDADLAGGLVLEMAGRTIANDGVLEATGGGLLLIEDTTVNDVGGGAITAVDTRVDLENAVIVGGSLNGVGKGAIAVVSGGRAVLDATLANPIGLTGNFVLENGASATIEGLIVNEGKIFVEGASQVTDLVIGVGGAVLAGGGSIVMADSAHSHIFAASAGPISLANLDNTISGAGTISDANLTLVNGATGVIDGNGGQALVISTGANTVANAGVIEARGSGGVVVRSALDNTGLIYAEGGNFTVNGAVTGDGTARVKSATLDFTSTFTQNVFFTGATGVLELARSRSYAGTVTGFSAGGGARLDLGDIGFVGAGEATFSGTRTGGVLTVTDGVHSAHIDLEGDYLGATFEASSDGHGGTLVVDGAALGSQAIASVATHQFVAVMAGFGAGGPVGAAREVHPDALRPALMAPRAAAFA